MIEDKQKINAVTVFTEYLSKNKLRKTSERFAILDMVMNETGHFEIDTLYKQMETDAFHVSLATIYNTLNLLCECGLVRKHMFNNQQGHYERVLQKVAHNHLICTVCGKVKEVKDNELLAFMNSKRYPSFTMEYFSLYVHGECSSCSRKRKAMQRRDKKKK